MNKFLISKPKTMSDLDKNFEYQVRTEYVLFLSKQYHEYTTRTEYDSIQDCQN